jgi:soluble lytic murein transglycosylase-like protein
MRGGLQNLSRLNAAPASLAAAALFAFAAVFPTAATAKPHAVGSGSETNQIYSSSGDAGQGEVADGFSSSVAYALPRNAPSADVEIILPQPLPPSAVAQYQRIIALQEDGEIGAADDLMIRLDDTTLVGSILAARYLAPGARPSSAQLLNWYEQYNNEPAAAGIYQLMAEKMPRASLPLAPQFSLLPEATEGDAGDFKPSMPNDNPAWRASFTAGIAAWQRGDIAGAGALFSRAANIAAASDADRAAGAFWAARAALRQQQPEAYLNWLNQAAQANDTFYGMIAGRLLGQGFGPTGIAATLTEADITAVDATPAGHLAFALLQVGEVDQATLALRSLWPDMQADSGLAHAVMAVAARAGLVDVAIAIAGQDPDTGSEIAGARLPLPALHPLGGFTVDPALVYALARTESGFEPNVVSPAGARGLMQLMPVTAHYIARTQGISGSLADPSANLAIGQGYIRFLAGQSGINNNLLAILASYNAGQGAAAAWFGGDQPGADPLLALESIPNDETRHFVHQVLTDSWIYAEELGLRPQSLDDLAEGNVPQLRDETAIASAN